MNRILSLALMGVFFSGLAGQVVQPEEDRFRANPHEAEERARREAEYRELYEEELAATRLAENEWFRQVFAPRMYDELFDTDLPGKKRQGQWRIDLSPKFSDFFEDDYVRFGLGLKYQFSDYFEAFTEAGTYFGNPFEGGGDAGMYNWRVGAKYSWIGIYGSRWNLAVGARADMPVFSPPLELTDGYARYQPFLSLSRHLEKHPDWLVYLNLAYQFVDETPFRADPIQPQPKDRLFVRPGFIFYPGGNFRYSLEWEYRTNALDFREEEKDTALPVRPVPSGFRQENWILARTTVHEVIVYPAITWFPGKETRAGFFLPGNWDLGLQLEVPLIEETGQDLGASLRFRWYYDYRHFLASDLPDLIQRMNRSDSQPP